MNIADLSAEQIQLFLLTFVRITALVSLLPVFGAAAVPVQLKAGLSFVLALLIFPTLGPPAQAAVSIPLFFFSVVKEIFVGLVLGFATTFLFAGVQFAGRLIDMQMGFSLVQVIDPFTESQVSTTGQLQILLFTILFLAINGHYFLLLAIQKSFMVIPLLGVQAPAGSLASYFSGLVGNVFVVAIQLAAPVFVVLVLTSLSLGIVARTVPQINIFFVGMPLKIAVGIGTFVLVLPALAAVFQGIVKAMIGDIWKLLHLMA
jgi:flagellar biosynthetic protein FliR